MSITVGGLVSEKIEGTEALADETGSEVQAGRANRTSYDEGRADRGGSSDGGVLSCELGQRKRWGRRLLRMKGEG